MIMVVIMSDGDHGSDHGGDYADDHGGDHDVAMVVIRTVGPHDLYW